MREIKLTRGYVALVSDEDYDRISVHKWCASESWSRGKMHNVYAIRSADGYTLRMHRFILGVDEHKVEVDHIDGNGLNNQRHNLRTGSRSDNATNMPKRKDAKWSEFKGVVLHVQSGLWRCELSLGGVRIYLGYYRTEIEAAMAYDIASLLFRGEFARLNFASGPPLPVI